MKYTDPKRIADLMPAQELKEFLVSLTADTRLEDDEERSAKGEEMLLEALGSYRTISSSDFEYEYSVRYLGCLTQADVWWVEQRIYVISSGSKTLVSVGHPLAYLLYDPKGRPITIVLLYDGAGGTTHDLDGAEELWARWISMDERELLCPVSLILALDRRVYGVLTI